MTDKMLDFVISSIRDQEKRVREEWESDKPKPFSSFFVDVEAGSLVDPCKKQAEHHRSREKFYVKQLEKAEKELKDKGVTVEVFDQATGTYANFGNMTASGNMTGAPTQNFQPRVDQRLADAVKNAKNKMLEHRVKAEKYEKEQKAFSLGPRFKVRLSVEDIYYFRLESI